MIAFIETLNFYMAGGGLLTFLIAAILVVDLKREQTLRTLVRRYGLWAALGVSAGSSIMALVYSDVLGFEPCGLCWFERIFLFPQVVLLLTALYFKDTLVARYGIALSLCGIVVSLYHHYLQMGGAEFIKCPAAGGADCTSKILDEFGFMTFPLLAAATFALLIALYYYILKTR